MSLQIQFESDIRTVDSLERVDTFFFQGIDHRFEPLFMKEWSLQIKI